MSAAVARRSGSGDRIVDWVCMIRRDIEKAPDLRLTLGDAPRRWDLDEARLEAILDALVEAGRRRRSLRGVYSRWPRRRARHGTKAFDVDLLVCGCCVVPPTSTGVTAMTW